MPFAAAAPSTRHTFPCSLFVLTSTHCVQVHFINGIRISPCRIPFSDTLTAPPQSRVFFTQGCSQHLASSSPMITGSLAEIPTSTFSLKYSLAWSRHRTANCSRRHSHRGASVCENRLLNTVAPWMLVFINGVWKGDCKKTLDLKCTVYKQAGTIKKNECLYTRHNSFPYRAGFYGCHAIITIAFIEL